jgi:transposase
MRKERKHYTAEEKVAILRRHLLDKVPVSDLCEELGLQPTVLYRWQKEFFENGAAAFQSQERATRRMDDKQKRIEFFGEEGADQGRGPWPS